MPQKLCLLGLLSAACVHGFDLPIFPTLKFNPAIYSKHRRPNSTFADVRIENRLFDFEPYELDVQNYPLSPGVLEAFLLDPNVISVQGNDGLDHVCRVPPLKNDSEDNPYETAFEGSQTKDALLKRQLVLARKLQPSCVTSKGGYWTYEVCPFKHVRQFHRKSRPTAEELSAAAVAAAGAVKGEEGGRDVPKKILDDTMNQLLRAAVITEEVITEEYLLGRYIPSSTLQDGEGDASDRIVDDVLVQKYHDGDRCETLAGSPLRRVDVYYECDPTEGPIYHILDVAEIASCSYRIRIGSRLFCLVGRFSRPLGETVLCYPSLPSPHVTNKGTVEDKDAGRTEPQPDRNDRKKQRELLRLQLHDFLNSGSTNFPIVHKLITDFMRDQNIPMPEGEHEIPDLLLARWLSIFDRDLERAPPTRRASTDRSASPSKDQVEGGASGDEDEERTRGRQYVGAVPF